MFQKATKKRARLRMGLVGPSGSGKTFTALRVGVALGEKIAVIDSERGSASKYADKFGFDVVELESFDPRKYVEVINAAGEAGYDVLVIDSLSHAWNGKDGALEMVDNAAKRSKSGNSFGAWRDVTPVHNALVDAILRSKCHVIATMRAKTEWILEKDERTGKQTPRKVGLQPVQRDGMEYEFDVVGDLDDASFAISKTRCSALKEKVFREPGEDLAEILKGWLTDGEDVPEPQREPKAAPVAKAQADLLRARAKKIRKRQAQQQRRSPDLGGARPGRRHSERKMDGHRDG
jgi:hypothetical protein